MALPEDFSKIFGSTATGGITPISDVNYAKGWEYVGANPPTKNDFSYLQQISDLKSQWLYNNLSPHGFATITASGSFTVPGNVTKIYLIASAGGGGGGAGGGGSSSYFGGGGGGGGSGQSIMKKPFSVTPGQVIPITIGAAGNGANGTISAGTNGLAGGNTVIGSLQTLLGGGGGFGGTNNSSPSVTTPGGNGGAGYPNGGTGGDGALAYGTAQGGVGSSCALGGGGGNGRAGTDAGLPGASAFGYGSGGGGGGGKYSSVSGANTGGRGGNGMPGIVIIEW